MMDNYDVWASHEMEQEKALEQLYHCDYCGKPIQDDYYYDINGDSICEKCLNNHFRKDARE